ncbi:capsule biosynthesis protein CapA [Roseobacter sp. HKCCD9010]|nr:capsule biosynthesis protein CapA [Rhodobacterales bacterium HKCCD4356]NNV10336.1 capsule biosynthesis protein CapA [Roseobacter sp. HKCCD7357]NNV18156.1 capsule biosynthesis protein CapA [Roseobacter sp. HKCCD8768]NNV27616.1 capsule biosynthesis protein CapA [Roseobacter sp. HKCCD8192]NNV31882.1 capsule biosynthesis protein CapA [Roseobacter sp. HKCCD9061]NNV36135.1 capsule biosynthesis protein CapA [Roseobacter sp. HKCCD9073]NNV40393.1 capsule biosynthesis protein CapA [Roseobacter sp. H
MLRAAGADVWRVGFNQGDSAFWHHRESYIAYTGTVEDWPDHLQSLIADKGVTDLVLYGDTRPIHSEAVTIAKARGLTVHVFEEGYLRPYWITYERGGANGHSRLMSTSVAQMRKALKRLDLDLPDTPSKWGDMRQHIFYGALYHWFVMFLNMRYRHFRPHRNITVGRELWLYLRRITFMPFLWFDRVQATWRIKTGGFPYHLALLQLEHDASFRDHGPFDTMADFLAVLIEGFAEGAPAHHHLVFKAHPLEDGRVPIRQDIRRLAAEHGVTDRVHYVRGGKLARLLNDARSAVTVNSTAAQQALWRGLPLKAFGTAVYLKPEFVSTQTMEAFFTNPNRPDSRAYRDYRHYLLETSQITGSFYSSRGRRQLLRQVVDMMLSPEDPYDALDAGRPAPRQHLQVVK